MTTIVRAWVVASCFFVAQFAISSAEAASAECKKGDVYEDKCSGSRDGVGVGNTSDSFRVTLYSASGTAIDFTPGRGSAPTHNYEWMWVPACWRNSPDNTEMLCGGFQSCPDDDDLNWWIYYRDLDKPNDSWHFVGAHCLGPDPTYDLATARAEIARRVADLPVEAGTMHVQPSRAAVVNLPAIFYVETPQQLHLTLTALGRSVSVTATPASYTWHWGDGTTETTTDPGRPHPNETVTHTYRSPGAVEAYVTVTWQASYSIAGIARTFTITGPANALPSASTPPQRIPVAEAKSHLVSQ